MRKTTTGLVVAALLVSLPISTAATLAQEEPSSNSSRTQQARQIAQAKLDEAKKKVVQARCVAAAGRLKGVLVRAEAHAQAFSTIYSNYRTRLNNLVARLNSQNVSTSELEADLKAMDILVASIAEKMEAYGSALQDLASSSNCADDPEAFYDKLEEARSLRVDIVDAIKEVKELIRSQIKPDLEAIRAALKEANAGSTEEDENE